MQSFISNMLNIVIQHVLAYTPYDIIRSSDDFQDVKLALNHRTDWSIELFRSCLTIHLINNNYFMMPSIFFLVIAETMHIHYGRLSAAELKERVESMGCVTFAILFAALDVGFIVVRVAGLVALSGTSGHAVTLVLITISLSVILPLLAYAAKLATGRRGRAPDGEGVEV